MTSARLVATYPFRLLPWAAAAILLGYLTTTSIGTYNSFTVGTIAVATVASIGLNLLVGNAGLISLATPAFMAAGAYGSAIILQHTALGLVLALILPVLAALVVGALVGLLALRLRGFYLGLATLGLLEAVQYFLLEGGSLVGSGYGFAMPTTTLGGVTITFEDWSGIAAGVAVCAIGSAWSIRRSRVGRALTLLRENETVAGCMGINTIALKIGTFAVTAGFGAAAGVLSGNVEGAVSPNVFSLTLAVSQLAFIIFGGLGYVSGAVLGTALLMALPVWFTSLGTNEGILYAAVLLFVVIVSPRGMVSVAIDAYRALMRRFRPAAAPRETARSAWSPVRELLERALPRSVASAPAPVALTKMRDIRAAASRYSPDEAPARGVDSAATPLVVFDTVSVRYGGLTAVDAVSLSVRAGRVHGLIGPNGAGKSSLVAALFGISRVASGTIAVNGTELQSTSRRRPPWKVAQSGVGRTFQTPAAGRGLTVLESVENGVYSHLHTGFVRAALRSPRVSADEIEARDAALNALELVHFTAGPKKLVTELTLGELRRVELARVLAAEPQVIVLDEPTSGLELSDADLLFSLLRDLTADGSRAVLVVEHNVRLIFQYCDEISVLNLGQLIAEGAPSDVAEHVAVKEAYLGHH